MVREVLGHWAGTVLVWSLASLGSLWTPICGVCSSGQRRRPTGVYKRGRTQPCSYTQKGNSLAGAGRHESAAWGRWALAPGAHLSLKGTASGVLENPKCSQPTSQPGLLQSVLTFTLAHAQSWPRHHNSPVLRRWVWPLAVGSGFCHCRCLFPA